MASKEAKQKPVIVEEKPKFERTFGFNLKDLTSWVNFVRLMNRPCHPASLGLFRVCYGILMIIDLLDERGLSSASYFWGNSQMCYFPLIHGMDPLPLHWMILIYIIMTFGAFGILLGFMFRISCAMFAFSYWYILLLERSRWNNHSYLFGLVAVILLCSDANRYWSLDGLIWKHKQNAAIPLWNYYMPRFQLFILYFIAGLKKFDSDWTHGYSMNLASNWVFYPFRLLFSKETVNMFFVHTAGHLIDLSLVYLLFFDKTRIVGMTIGFAFNFMNATMFSIGMFPYMCIVTLPLFCSFDWPVVWFQKLPNCVKFIAPINKPVQPSHHCIYTKESIETSKHSEPNCAEISTEKSSTKHMSNKIRFYHKFFAALVIIYSTEQLFLPYSHFITQGYNDWKQGIYGYSWDMMIRSWRMQHSKITYIVKDTGEVGHIQPNSFVLRDNKWCKSADAAKLYAKCLEKRLAERNITNVEIYFDVWVSMNRRFMQRSINPSVNILTAEWSLFKRAKWIFPLLDDLTSWRSEILKIRNISENASKYTKTAFMADFPGQVVNNYVQEEIDQVNLTVLAGNVEVELPAQNITYTLNAGETMELPSEEFHNIKTVSDRPSCFYYTYTDFYKKIEDEGYQDYVANLKSEQNVTDVHSLNVTTTAGDDELTGIYKHHIASKKERRSRNSWLSKIASYFTPTYLFEAWYEIKLAVRIYRSGQNQDIVQEEISRETDPEGYSSRRKDEEYNEYAMFYIEPSFNETTNETVYIKSLRHSSFLHHSEDVKFTEDKH